MSLDWGWTDCEVVPEWPEAGEDEARTGADEPGGRLDRFTAVLERRPATLYYAPSDRPYAGCLTPITYPEHFEIRRVSTNGGIRWNRRWVNVSHILAELPVGLEPLTEGTWNLFFGPMHLGWLDEHDYRIHDHRGRLTRRRKLSPIN